MLKRFEEGEFDNCADVLDDWFNSCNIQGIAQMETTEVVELLDCMRDIEKRKAAAPKKEAVGRALRIKDPIIDMRVKEMCEYYGYGAVMDSAARQWALKDSVGAFYIAGECLQVEDLEKFDADT